MSKFEADKSGDEITLKELVLKIQEYFKEVISHWLIICIFCVFTLCFFIYKHVNHTPEYSAELKFVVENNSGSTSGFGGILGSLGIKNKGGVNPNKVIEVAKSMKLTKKFLFSHNENSSVLANQIIEEYDLLSEWANNNPLYEGFKFDALNTDIEKGTIKRLKGIVWGTSDQKALLNIGFNDDTGIYSIISNTTSEHLSIDLSNRLYLFIKKFFEDEIFENQKKSRQILAVKADSINRIRNNKIHQLANFDDQNKNLLFKVDESKKTILSKEIQFLNAAHAELLKNYEVADINLKNWQPLFLEIDNPFSPISPSKSSLIKNILLGVISGFFLGTLFILLRKVFNDIMQS